MVSCRSPDRNTCRLQIRTPGGGGAGRPPASWRPVKFPRTSVWELHLCVCVQWSDYVFVRRSSLLRYSGAADRRRWSHATSRFLIFASCRFRSATCGTWRVDPQFVITQSDSDDFTLLSGSHTHQVCIYFIYFKLEVNSLPVRLQNNPTETFLNLFFDWNVS